MLTELIKSLNKEEIRHFKLVSQSVKNSSSRLDLDLFDSIRYDKGGLGEDGFRLKLYAGKDNAFYRLKNRLHSKVARSLLLLHSADDLHHETLEFVLLAKLWHGRGKYQLSFYYLKKAEKKAIDLDNFDYMNIIYQEFVKLSYHISEIQPSEIIEKQRDILEKQRKINELNNVLAIVIHQLKKTQNMTKGSDAINELLRITVERYSTDESLQSSFQFRYTLYQAISQFLIQQNSFEALRDYVQKTLIEFESDELFSKTNHDKKLQMLTYLVNASFKSGKEKMSLEYTEILYDEMMRFGKLHYQKYLIFYYQSLVINFSESQPQRAIRILEEVRDDSYFLSDPYYTQFVHFNLAILYFKLDHTDRAIGSLDTLLQSQFFSEFDQSFREQMIVLKLIILYEAEKYEEVLVLGAKVLNPSSKKGEPLGAFHQSYVRTVVRLSNREGFEISEELQRQCRDELGNYLNEDDSKFVFSFISWIRGIVC